ncbi:MAG: single-stranded-DNA-specific exonuclease RecJ [Eubacteriales bacterium]
MKGKRWIFREYAQNRIEEVRAFSRECGCSPLVALLMLNRGVNQPEQARCFLAHEWCGLPDPFAMKGMEAACRRICQALQQDEEVVVYGDYDVDGITSSSVLVLYLREMGLRAGYYIPDRMEEGYGVNQEAVKALAQSGVKLLITVDCGVTACAEVELARQLGMDVLITDHHECGEMLPQNCTVVNPRQEDCPYPFKELAGVGVAFKLICALQQYRGLPVDDAFINRYVDLVAVGTVADVMPLQGENRTIVQRGLELLEHSRRPGVRALLSRSGVADGKKLTAGTVSFSMAPRINAAGRVGCAGRAVGLFLTQDPHEAAELAEELCQENQLRQKTENDIMQQALAMLEQQNFDPLERRVAVLWQEGWHHGVIGIVASRISDLYSCPVILISLEGEKGKGSGRSIPGFNLYEALEHCASRLTKFGGHALAAGLSLEREQLENFRQEMEEYARQHLDPACMVPAIYVDGTLEEEHLTMEVARELSKLEPYGVGNPTPVFHIPDMTLADIIPISNDKHLRLTLKKGDVTLTGLAFSTSSQELHLSRGDQVDVVGQLDINLYRGRESLQFILKDARLSQRQQREGQYYRELYQSIRERTAEAQQVRPVIPGRESFVAVYRYIRQNAADGRQFRGALDTLERDISWYSHIQLNYATMRICLEVLEELGLAICQEEGQDIHITLCQNEGKVNLNASEILQKLRSL